MAKILYIEDETFIMKSFLLILNLANHEVTEAHNGEEAIKYLKSNLKFDLIILDIMLPRGDSKTVQYIPDNIETDKMGIEILRQLRVEMKKDIPVIVLSAVKDSELKAEILALGVEKYFDKPVPMKKFTNEVNRVLSPL